MKAAYLIDRESIGGGCEYVRQKILSRPDDECRAFYSANGECSPGNLMKWGADEVCVNHLRAAVQLFNPLRSLTPASRRFLRSANIYFVAHGIHSRKYEYMPRTLVNAVKCYLRVKLERWIYRRCRRVVVLTRSDEAKARELYGLDLELVVESNTLDGWVAPNMEQTFKGERYSHVYIGRFCFQKGQDIWIRKMAEGSVDGRTLFIGAGETLDECKLLARRLGIYDRCSFAGEIEGAERYLKCADCVVSASRWEGMPYLMMKARSLGCRILATDCPGNRDVLKGYSNATMFPVEDADASSGLLCSCHAN